MRFSPKVQKVQLLMNKKVGSALKPDGLYGSYTAEVTWMTAKALGLPVSKIITNELIRKLIEAEDGSVLPESFEPINYRYRAFSGGEIQKIYNWIKSKKKSTILKYSDIYRIAVVCWFMRYSFLHCNAHLIIESGWGTSDKIRYRRNGFGIGVTDSRERRYKLKYLKVDTSAYEWCSLLDRLYIPRNQDSEQLLNLDYGRYGKHPDWFNLKEIPKNWRPYATSQSKSVSCGLLVREMRRILNE